LSLHFFGFKITKVPMAVNAEDFVILSMIIYVQTKPCKLTMCFLIA